jgi:hypothetical protein
MSSISMVGNSELELEHMIARVSFPAAGRLPDKPSGDRAPETPENPRRQGRGSSHPAQRKQGDRKDGQSGGGEQPASQPPGDEVQLYSPSQKSGVSCSKDQAQHNVDIRA